MSAFETRERAFETQFAHNNELAFKAAARRNKLMGLWAAERLGKDGTLAEAYAHGLVMDSLQSGGEAGLVEKVMFDLRAAGASHSEKDIRIALAQCTEAARQQLQ